MKIELGAQFVSKFVQMGIDMKSSRDSTESFKQLAHKGIISGVELSVKVLTSGLWGQEQSAPCLFPPALKTCCDRFEEYYKMLHSGRHLIWTAGIGDCEVRSLIYQKPYSFNMTVYQAVIISMFNENASYTFKDLSEATRLPSDLLSVQLLPIVNPRMGKLIIKENLKSKSFTPGEVLQVNTEFSSASLRSTMIPPPAQKVVYYII